MKFQELGPETRRQASAGTIQHARHQPHRPPITPTPLTWKGSTSRNSATMSDDLPEPVRPTMPIFSPGFTTKLTPAATRGAACKFVSGMQKRQGGVADQCREAGGRHMRAHRLPKPARKQAVGHPSKPPTAQHGVQLRAVAHPHIAVLNAPLLRPLGLQ